MPVNKESKKKNNKNEVSNLVEHLTKIQSAKPRFWRIIEKCLVSFNNISIKITGQVSSFPQH